MNYGLLCGLFMVKHHGLIIKGVAVWNHTFKQVPIALEPINIIGVAVWCLFLIYPLGLSGTSDLEGLFPILKHHIKQEANCHIQIECGDCCGLP